MAEGDNDDLNEVIREFPLTATVNAYIVSYDGGPPRLGFGRKKDDGYKFVKRLDIDAAAKLPDAIAFFKKSGDIK